MPSAKAKSPNKMECGCSENKGRNLVVCIDGTNNQFGDKNTNVIELYHLLIKDSVGPGKQLTWYNSGIGTYAKPSWFSYESLKQWIGSGVDEAIAWNFEAIILDAYRWLSDVYKSGDRIFLFGFSRGAYQVRALAAMIDKVGLIYRGNEAQIPFAFELFANPAAGSVLTKQTGGIANDEDIPMAERFKRTFAHGSERDGKYEGVRVHFVGVWDTVSSVGFVRGKTLPGTTDGMQHVCYFRHALALDERRVKFLPEYAYGGVSEQPAEKPKAEEKGGLMATLTRPFQGWFGSKEETLKTAAPSESTSTLTHVEQSVSQSIPVDTKAASSKDPAQGKSQPQKIFEQTKEVWFAGSHSDVGGGNEDNKKLDRGLPPLRWMCFEAAIAGLHVRQFTRNHDPDAKIKVYPSLTWKWQVLEYAPVLRLTYNGADATVRGMHQGAGRKIAKGQRIHSSVVGSKWFTGVDVDVNHTYKPAAELYDGVSWDELRKPGALPDLVENDLYDGLPGLLREHALKTTSPERKNVIAAMLVSAGGQWGLSQRLKNQKITLDPSQASQELCTILHVYGKQRPTELLSRAQVDELLSDRLELNDDKQKSAKRLFLGQFTEPPTGFSLDCTSVSRRVVFSPDGTRFAMAHDQAICVRYAATGEWIRSAEVDEYAYCLAFSRDGRHLVAVSSRTGSYTCSVYDIDAGMKETKLALKGSPYSCALVSGVGGDMLAVCGDEDGRVFAYNMEGGLVWESVDKKHVRPVLCLAISQDGKRIASGSRDSTIHIWDAAKGKYLGSPFTLNVDTHEWVTSLAFSADGTQLAVGSDEGRVWLLDLQSERAAPATTQVDGYIQQVAVRAASNGQNHVVFATQSGRVFFWDASDTQSANIYGGDDHHVAVLSPDCETVLTGYRKLLDVAPDIGYWSGDLMRQINAA